MKACYTHIFFLVSVCRCVCVCVCLYVCLNVCVPVCVYLWACVVVVYSLPSTDDDVISLYFALFRSISLYFALFRSLTCARARALSLSFVMYWKEEIFVQGGEDS